MDHKKRLTTTAYASIHGGWGAGELAWLLEVREYIESLEEEVATLKRLQGPAEPS